MDFLDYFLLISVTNVSGMRQKLARSLVVARDEAIRRPVYFPDCFVPYNDENAQMLCQ
jgi:hypothetical protein